MNRQQVTARGVETWMLICVVFWAANYPVVKYGLSAIHPLVFNSLRFLVAAAVLAVPFAFGAGWKRIERADYAGIVRAGVISGVIYQVAFIIGMSMTSAGNSAVLLSTSPLWTVLIHARMHREKIPKTMVAGMAVSLAGIVMIIAGSGKKILLGGTDLVGDLIVLAAAALWALNTNLQKPLLVRYSSLQLSFLLVLFGALGLTLIALPLAWRIPWGTIHWSFYGSAVVSGALANGVSSWLWALGVQVLGPGRTANFNNLVPVLAFLLSYVLLREELLPIQIAGAAATVLGVWIARR